MNKSNKSITNYHLFLNCIFKYAHVFFYVGIILYCLLPQIGYAQQNDITEAIKEKGSIAYNIVWSIAILVAVIWGVVVAIKLKTQGQQALKDVLWYLGGLIFMGLVIAIVKSFTNTSSGNSFNDAFGQ